MTIPESSPPPTATTVLPPPTSTSAAEVIQQQTAVQDYVILRYAVIGLIIIALVAIVGSLILISKSSGQEVPAGVTAIIALGGVAVGGISTMLVRPPLYPPPPAVKLGGVVDRRVP